MSKERPLPTRRDLDPDQPNTNTVPDHVPGYTERTDTLPDNGHDRRRLGWAVKLGVPVAAIALAGGVFLGKNAIATNHNPETGKAGDRPTATAPAVPGQTHETQSAPAYDPNNYKTWTANHVPLVINGPDGKVDNYDSVQSYSDALMIPGVSPEEIANNPTQYADQFLAAVNSYIASVSNPKAYSKYADVPAPNADSIGSTGAILDQYVRPGFEQAITGTPEKGASMLGTDDMQSWLDAMNQLGHDYNHYNHVTGGEYKAKWVLDPTSDTPAGYTVYDTNTDTIHIFMRVDLVDNMSQTSLNGQQNADGSVTSSLDTNQLWNMEVQRQEVGGKSVMRIISMSTAQRQSM